jgi:CRP-like cAMP-binding protein
MSGASERSFERALALGATELFATVDPGLLLAIADRCEELTVPADELLFAAGDPGGAMFVILEGEAAVRTDDGRTLSTVGAGDVLGELAALDGAPRSASVIAQSDLVALRLPAELLLELAVTRAAVGQSLLRLVARRLHARTTTSS